VCGGQVLVVVLLGIVVLAGLIFYVVNVGDQVNRRVVMQNAADATAIAGTAWMARSMNVVAMNNVAQTRMLALVPVLDAFPLATKMAYEEVYAWVECLQGQLARGVPDTRLREGLESLRARMAKQRDILSPLNDYFNPGGQIGVPVTPLTTWRIRGATGPPPHGTLWQAAESLDEFNKATALSAGALSQTNAVRFGQLNNAEVAFVVPVLPTMPAVRRGFADFEQPVKKGLIPDRAYPQRLGVYDRLFKWRHYQYRNVYEKSHVVPGSPGHGPIRGGKGNVGATGRTRGRSARGHTSNPDPHWAYRVVGRMLMGYTVYGPYEWMLGHITGWSHGGWWEEKNWYAGQLADTYFHEYQKNVSGIKLGYMWGSQALRRIHYPQWIPDFPQAKALAEAGDIRISRTMFYVVEIRSKHPKGGAGWLTPGTYVTNGELPIAMWVQGWEDPTKWEEGTDDKPGVPRLSDWVWEDQYTYETTEDWDIGIRKQLDAEGDPKWQTVYMVAQWVFGGIDVGGEVEVTNPANYDDRSVLPAPVLMDTAQGDYDMSQPHHDQGVRRGLFTYLGVASHSDRAAVWPKKFASGNPFGGVCAVAQAEIFNTTSWDLWTQDWKAKLVPVTRWGDWMDRLDAGAGDAPTTGGAFIQDNIRMIHEYLSRFDEQMVNEVMHH